MPLRPAAVVQEASACRMKMCARSKNRSAKNKKRPVRDSSYPSPLICFAFAAAGVAHSFLLPFLFHVFRIGNSIQSRTDVPISFQREIHGALNSTRLTERLVPRCRFAVQLFHDRDNKKV
jgi:hypothetical protein